MISFTFPCKQLAAACSLFFLFICASTQMKAVSLTFAQFTDNGKQDFSLTNIPDGSQVLNINSAVLFTFSNVPGLPTALQGPISATFTMTAVSNLNVGLINIAGAQQAYIGGFSGTFQFTADVGNLGNTNLLSGTFGNQGLLIGQEGGQSATFSDTATTGSLSEVHLTSNLIAFPGQSQENFSISLSSIFDTQLQEGGLHVTGSNVDNFNAAGTGTFASNPAPYFSSTATPEASSCGLFGIGLVVLGGLRCAKGPKTVKTMSVVAPTARA